MTTTDKYMNVTNKRLFGASDFGDRFLEYMRSQAEETNRRTYDADTFLKDGVTISADGNDKFKVVPDSSGVVAADGDGHFLDITVSSYMTGLQFENVIAAGYYVGLKYGEIPYEIQVNPRTGNPEYVAYEEQIADIVKPNSVVDNGGNITFVVDSSAESGADNTGRTVKIWLVNPAEGASTAAIAIEDCLITYSGGQNKITTVGTLGQTTVSTVGGDYLAALMGPSVKRYTDLRTEDGYAFVGEITGTGAGNPPAVFDHADQRVVPFSWVSALVDGLPQDFVPLTDNTYDLGSASKQWANIYTANLVVSADLLPVTDDAQDLGSALKRWQDLFLSGTMTIDGNILPEADDASDLGGISYEWKDLYIDGVARIDTLALGVAAGEGVSTSCVPTADDSKDLGNSSYEWGDLYVDGVAYVDTLSLSEAAGEGVSTNLVPTGNGTLNLGSITYEYNHLYSSGIAYIDALNIASTAGLGCVTDFVPNADDSLDLGNTTYQWKDLHVDGIALIDTLKLAIGAGLGVDTKIMPVGDSTLDIGDDTYRWNEIFVDTLNLSVANGEGAYTIVPVSDGDRNLGSGSYEWNHLYLDGIAYMDVLSVSDTAAEGVTTHLVPNADNTRDLGNGTYKWKDIHINGIAYLDEAWITTLSSSMNPNTSDSIDLGTAGVYFGDIYCDNIFYKTSSATFDSEDDLALIEAYQSTTERATIEKGGESHSIFKGDANTIPWPMLGPVCPLDGVPFIDPGDSLMFLLGAVKQLFQRHKSENKRLEEIIEGLTGRIEAIEAT